MSIKRVFSQEFDKVFNGNIILDTAIESKLLNKHKVYKSDIEDALSDPYLVVMRNKQKSPSPTISLKTKGTVYEILCETEAKRVMFIVARLFPDGNLYIITAYWADKNLTTIYYQESEVLRND